MVCIIISIEKCLHIYQSCLARRSLVCIPHSKGLSVYSESTRSPANENGPIYLRSQKTKQSKRMNAISLDNSLHFSGSPFAFLGIFSLGRGTPNSQLYSSATVWSPKCTEYFLLLARIVATRNRIAQWNIYRHCMFPNWLESHLPKVKVGVPD